MADSDKEHFVTAIEDDHEATCWGCGLRLLLPSYSPIFKCGWCGAITRQNERKCENSGFWWRRARDRCFVCIIISFMLFVIFGGIWAVYPFIFSVSYFCGILHSSIAVILSITTISFFSLAAFRCPGTPPIVEWVSYPIVEKGSLENYTFCHFCSKPKSPRTHHCSSCRTCVMDMDHHCPFIGNCVGASNHRYFIAFLFSAIVSTIYVALMSVYAVMHVWPPLSVRSLGHLGFINSQIAWRILKEVIIAFLSSALLLSTRGLVLVYLFFSSVSVLIGLSVLFWQQLCFIYLGKTYLSQLSSPGEVAGEKDCKNLFRFFGCPYLILRYLPNILNAPKKHKK